MMHSGCHSRKHRALSVNACDTLKYAIRIVNTPLSLFKYTLVTLFIVYI